MSRSVFQVSLPKATRHQIKLAVRHATPEIFDAALSTVEEKMFTFAFDAFPFHDWEPDIESNLSVEGGEINPRVRTDAILERKQVFSTL